MKKHQSYVVTFCRSNSNSSSSIGGYCSSSDDHDPNSPLMERKQGSSMDPLIKPRRGSNININIVKKSGDETLDGSKSELSGCPNTNMEDEIGTNRVVTRMRDKFRGCLLGALVGDCIGTLFERDYSVSYTLLEELYHSLTNLSEDEKLMDLHGIDGTLEPKRVKEMLESKRQSYASLMGKSMVSEDDDVFLKPFVRNEAMMGRRGSAMVTGTTKPLLPGGTGSRRGSFSRPIEKFSDDMVMTTSVCYSLTKCKGFDGRHLAKQMTEDYFLNMNRGFGSYIRDIFVQLRENGYQDPYGPAKKSANVIGAQGNEAASRVSPIALFCCRPNELQLLVDLASKMSKITNANKQSVLGTVLQALAVHVAFNWEFQMETSTPSANSPGEPLEERVRNSSSSTSPRHSPLVTRRRQSQGFGKTLEIPVQNRVTVEQQPKYFCEQVLEKINAVEGRASSLFENLKQLMQQSVASNKEFLRPAEPTYCDKLRTVLEFLARSQPPARVEIIERLGNSNKAIDSVPTAIYSFLYATKNEMLPEMTTMIKSPVLRCIFHAISLGGEADTLASMSGAIAGAYWGYSQIPSEILRVCEGSTEVLKLADELFNITFKSSGGGSNK